MISTEDKIKLFGMSHGLVERDLDKTEKKFNIDLGRDHEDDKDEDYYPQFEQQLRIEASEMGNHYELFYCLEKSIRKLIYENLASAYGQAWWNNYAPPEVRKNVKENVQREIDNGVTPRSELEIDYTTFGELGNIVRANWDKFDAIFSSQKAFNKIMANLNMLRGPIAHCSPLAEDEIIRLQLTVRDWFRLME